MALLTIRYFTYHSRMILMRVPTDLPLGLSSRGGMGGQGMRWDGRAGEGQEAGRRGDPQLVIFEKKKPSIFWWQQKNGIPRGVSIVHASE